MHIAIDMQSTQGNKTGIGQCAEKLVAAMRALNPPHGLMTFDWGGDVRMRLDRRLRWQQFEVPRRAKRLRADVLHVPGFDAPLRKPCRVVLTVHDLIGMLFPRNLPPVSRFYWSRWLPFSVRFADLVIADSEATRRDLRQLIGYPEARIRVVPLGVDGRFVPQNAEAVQGCRARLNLPEKFVLYLGTLEPRKGIDTLMDAFGALKDTLPHHLVLAGKKGWYWDRIQTRIEANSIHDRVRVLGYVADEDLPALYSAASAFVFPSRYEGFGLPVLEAMACGVPVVTTNVSSLPEVAGDATLLVSPDNAQALRDAMLAALSDQTLANSLRSRGLQRAATFTWQRTAERTLRVYEEAAKMRGK